MLPLAKQEKAYLLQLARKTIEHRLFKRGLPLKVPTEKGLVQIAGAFVSLHLNEELRGCIGRIRSQEPLYQVIHEMAIAASSQDPRFPPVTSIELPQLLIEVSVLSELEKIKEVKEIEVGKHGLWVTAGPHSGVLLPQVAAEEGWDAESFVGFTCMKAGLPFNYWQENPITLEVFSAEVFSEKEV